MKGRPRAFLVSDVRGDESEETASPRFRPEQTRRGGDAEHVSDSVTTPISKRTFAPL